MKCLKNSCGKELPDDAKFCDKCGTSSQAMSNCRTCGASNVASAAFCMKCGKPQAEPTGDAGVMSELPTTGEFVYLADDKKMQMEAKKKTYVNAGVVAFTVTHGKVRNISLLNKNKSEDSDFFGAVSKVVTGIWGVLKNAFSEGTPDEAASGKLSKSSQVYVMLNLKGLPLLSHIRQTPIPGLPDANLRFEFWVDTENEKSFELFMQRCVGTRASLSCHELKEIAINAVELIIPTLTPTDWQTDPGRLALVLEQMTGISANCIFNPGKLGDRHQLDISRTYTRCPNKKADGQVCNHVMTKPAKFCGKCGGDCTGIDWKAFSFLQASGGEQLTLRLSMLANRTTGEVGVNIDNAKVAEEVIKYLGPELRRYDVPSLMRSSMLIQLSNFLNDKLLRDWRGHVTEFSVVDLRTTEQDWFFNTEALLAEELRSIAEDKKNLAIVESELDLKESAFKLVMRHIAQNDSEELTRRRLKLEKEAKTAELNAESELAEHELRVQTELRKDGISDEAAKQILAREKDEMLRKRDFLREETKGEREDEVGQIHHEITLEKTAAQHDIDLGDMAGEAKSRAVRRDISDGSFVKDEAIRLDAKRKEQLGNIDEDLEDRKKNRRVEEAGQLGNIQEDLDDRKEKRQIDKLRAMAELEASMTAQENAQELNKIDAMKSMGAAEMLAMQAADLAKNGASADMIRGITDASSGVKVAEAKEAATRELLAMQKEMMQLMMAQQNQSSAREAEALKLAVNVAQSTNEKSMESMMQVAKVSAAESNQGYKEAAKISQSVNEKSMDSMAKVATAAASHSTDGFKQAAEISRSVNEKSMESMATVYSTALSSVYVCRQCKKDVADTAAFCTGCGTPKVKD